MAQHRIDGWTHRGNHWRRQRDRPCHRKAVGGLRHENLPRRSEREGARPSGKGAVPTVVTVPTAVSRLEDVRRLKDRADDEFGEVAVLMNNAGVSAGGGPFDDYEGWQRVLSVNLWSVINGVHTFTQAMVAQRTPAAIVNTGSKQGISPALPATPPTT